MAQSESRPRQRRGNSVTLIGMVIAVLALIGLYLNGAFDLPHTLNQTDDMSVAHAGMVKVDETSPLQAIPNPVPGLLWKFDLTGLVRYDSGNVSVSPDNNLILTCDAGNVTPQSVVVVGIGNNSEPLDFYLPTRDHIVLARVEAVLSGISSESKSIVTMRITLIGNPEILPVPEG